MRFSKTLLCSTLLVSFALSLSAQQKLLNLPKYDHRPLHFGFFVGINYFDFHIEEIKDLAGLKNYYSTQSKVQPGYSIGFISNLRLDDYRDLRFILAFAATERILTFDVVDPITNAHTMEMRKIGSSFIEMPLRLKWKSERINNYRLYVLSGLKYDLDLASKENVKDNRIFKLTHNDISYEFGFGVDIYFEYFKFSPQIIGTWGFHNLMVRDGTFLVDGIDRLETRAILICFTFE